MEKCVEGPHPRGSGSGATALGALRQTAAQILLYALATRVVVAVVLLPSLAFALRLLMSWKGQTALSDQEILAFILSPVGLVALIVIGGFALGVAFVEQAGMITIGFGAAEGRRLTWIQALRWVGKRLPKILPLGSHVLARALMFAAPVLGASGLIFWLFLSDHDINYYLAERPAEFYWAGGLIAVLLAGLGLALVPRLLAWTLALPYVLFENLRPVAAIKKSEGKTRGRRWEILKWIVVWLVAGALASTVLTWIIGLIGRLLLPLVSGSLGMVAFAIGSIGLLTLLGNFLINLFASAWFSLVIVRFFREQVETAELPPELAKTAGLGDGAQGGIPGRRILALGAAALAVAVVLTVIICSRVKSEDHAIVIAHRGAAGQAPENTMAAVRQAIEDGADFVEIDVQEIVGGEVVVFHDSDFMKIAKNPLKIWDATPDQLQEIDIGSWFDPKFSVERVPTLEAVLRECKGRAKVNIELKYYGHDEQLEERVVDIVERNGMAEEVVIMSLKYEKVAKIKALRPGWTYGFLTSVSLGDNSQFEVNFLAINKAGAKRRFIRSTQQSGRELYVWTVNDPLQMSSMLGRGVDGIITDEPALARRVLELRAELNSVERLLMGLGAEVGVFSIQEGVLEGDQ